GATAQGRVVYRRQAVHSEGIRKYRGDGSGAVGTKPADTGRLLRLQARRAGKLGGRCVMKTLKGTLRFVALGCMLATPTPLLADLTLAQQPLFVGHGAGPNLLFILDDSGSMAWQYMPDSLENDGGASNGVCSGSRIFDFCLGDWLYNGQNASKKWFYSSHVNKVYFDPSVTYRPPLMANGTRKPNSSYTAAWTNGYNS